MEKTLKWNFSIQHLPGRENVVSDALSRFPVEKPKEEDNHGREEGLLGVIDSEKVTVAVEDVEKESVDDNEIKDVIQLLRSGMNDSSDKWGEHKHYYRFRNQLWSENNMLFLGRRMVVPLKLRSRCLETLHSAHQGVAGMKARASTTVWWPTIGNDIEDVRDRCIKCTVNAPSQAPTPPVSPRSPEYPFQMICSDYCVIRGMMFVVLVYRFSGWVGIERVRLETSKELQNILRYWFIQYGVPETFTSDGGTQYTSLSFREFLKNWGVEHHITASHHPHSNLRAETAVKTIKRLLLDCVGPGGTLENDKFARAILQYRNTPLRDIGLSPAQLIYARELRDCLPGRPVKY